MSESISNQGKTQSSSYPVKGAVQSDQLPSMPTAPSSSSKPRNGNGAESLGSNAARDKFRSLDIDDMLLRAAGNGAESEGRNAAKDKVGSLDIDDMIQRLGVLDVGYTGEASKSSTKPLIFVTGNPNKLKEVQEILSQGGDPIQIESQNLEIPEIQGTTIEVASAKCRRAAELIGDVGPCITEDTALCYEALNGLPGPYIKHFMTSIGHDGLNRMLVGFESKKAEAVCTFAYSFGPGSEPVIFEGRTEGTIVPARGPKVFGWDAVFEPLGYDMTYAEMPSEEKNKISHRGRALEKLKAYLRSLA